MPNVDTSLFNTFLLGLIGIGGSVFILRYVQPIISTQEKHRIFLDGQVAALTAKVDAGDKERALLKELVTQRASVDELAQRFKIAMDDTATSQRLIVQELGRHDREGADAHQRQILVLNEMVSALRQMGDQLRFPQRGERGPAGTDGLAGIDGERGEKGDHGQDVVALAGVTPPKRRRKAPAN